MNLQQKPGPTRIHRDPHTFTYHWTNELISRSSDQTNADPCTTMHCTNGSALISSPCPSPHSKTTANTVSGKTFPLINKPLAYARTVPWMENGLSTPFWALNGRSLNLVDHIEASGISGPFHLVRKQHLPSYDKVYKKARRIPIFLHHFTKDQTIFYYYNNNYSSTISQSTTTTTTTLPTTSPFNHHVYNSKCVSPLSSSLLSSLLRFLHQ